MTVLYNNDYPTVLTSVIHCRLYIAFEHGNINFKGTSIAGYYRHQESIRPALRGL